MFELTGSSTSAYVVIQTVFLDFKPSLVSFMTQKRSCSFSTKVTYNFYDMVKIFLIMINNVNIFTIFEFHSKTSQNCYRQFTKTKLMFRGKRVCSGFNYRERLVLLTVSKLFEHYFWQN